MQKLQDSVFSIVKTTNLSPAVFSFLQPTEEFSDKTPLGGILSDTKHGWLALGPKFCVVDLKTGLKVAAKVFGPTISNSKTSVISVVELPTPLTENSRQLIISLQCEDIIGLICVFHINGSQILRCIQTDVIVTNLSVCDEIPDGALACLDGVIIAGSKTGEIFVFDLNRACLIQALKNISQGYEHLIRNEENAASVTFLPLKAIHHIEEQRYLALENEDHIAVLLNDNALIDGQYIFRNPDGSVRMKAKRDHVRVSSLQYIPQIGSLSVGFNFGAFQIWNLMDLNLEFTSQVNIECLPVTNFGFQEPCDDPRAFCYLWVVFSVIDSFEEEEFPLAVMYSLTYRGKRMLSNTKFLYQEFSSATVVFEVELSTMDKESHLVGGRCVSCHSYSIHSTLGDEREDSLINICQLVWECWSEGANSPAEYGMLLFDLDQWYKAQMPATYELVSNAFMSATWCAQVGHALDVRLQPGSVSPYSHATKLEEHFYPNSLHYNCVCLNTSEASILNTVGIQRQIITSMDEVGPTILLNPPRLYKACVAAGLTPLYMNPYARSIISQEYQRRYLLSVALEARLSRFLKRCAHDWATGSHAGAGCTLTFLVDWCWLRAIELKENAKELTAPLFTSSSLPDRNVVRCLEYCVQQLTQLTGLLDAVLTKCCNLVVPDALSEMEEKYKGIGCVSLYFQVVQWFLRVGLLPERHLSPAAVTYPAQQLYANYNKRRVKLQRLQESPSLEGSSGSKSCPLLYIDQLIEQEFGGDRIHQMWIKGGSECNGLYPPPSLYSLLRLYLLPDIAEEHKHSLVLYLLVDYSMVYDEMRFEPVIRRLMQFPTMFGLSNTAIKATQAFWHLDHRDFDFALDQLQCLTGNTLSEWQHNVVLSTLLAQRKTQAALQYLHVRKPAPIQNLLQKDDMNCSNNKVNDHDKLDDWQSCCNLYLARELVFEALDVIRICVQHAGSLHDKKHVLNLFFKGCRSTGQLAKILQVSLSPFEEEVFVKYLKECNESQTSDLLIMYYLEQARYLEAQQYNANLKQYRGRKDMCTSAESLLEGADRDNARDTIVEVMCGALPNITTTVAHCVLDEKEFESHVFAPKPMSVYIQATSPKNTFTYKSSFIQDTIENASETWINKPKMRRGLKRALNIEETPFICTPKLTRTKSFFSDQSATGETPPKRSKFDPKATPKTPRVNTTMNVSPKLSEQISLLLDMPDIQSPECKLYERSGAETPHSILKTRSRRDSRETASPVDSRYLGESDDEMLETTSNHTHYSDATKHLRFTMPTASESGSTPSPVQYQCFKDTREKEISESVEEREIDDPYHAATSNLEESSPLDSPRETEEKSKAKKLYKDTVRARLSISNNSSLSDDPNASVESIADIPKIIINPRYSKTKTPQTEMEDTENTVVGEKQTMELEPEYGNRRSGRVSPIKPKNRKGLRDIRSESALRRSETPERQDSPIVTPLRSTRITRSRSRSRTPEMSPRSTVLPPIIEQPVQEVISEPHPKTSLLSASRQLRSRSCTPERSDKGVSESPKLESIEESPTKPTIIESPRRRRPLRSRPETSEVEVVTDNEPPVSPRSLRSRSKTPENLMSPKVERSAKGKKSLSRIVLESNTFAKTKDTDKPETEDKTPEKSILQSDSDTIIECTPMKPSKEAPNFMDVTFSPIVNKSILHSSVENELSGTVDRPDKSKSEELASKVDVKSLPAFTTIHESYFEKSVLQSYESTVGESSSVTQEVSIGKKTVDVEKIDFMSIKSVFKDVSSLLTSDSDIDLNNEEWKAEDDKASEIQKEKERIIEIEREINELEGDMSNEEDSSCGDDVVVIDELPDDNILEEERPSETDEDIIISLDSDMFSDDGSDKLEIHKQSSSDTNNQNVTPTTFETTAQVHSKIDLERTDVDTNKDSKESKTIGKKNGDILEPQVIESNEWPLEDIVEMEVYSEEIIELDANESASDPVKDENIGNDPLKADTEKTDDTNQTTKEIFKEKAKEIVTRVVEVETNEEVQRNVDPWIQGNFSLLTDDNSVLSDRSDLNLNYSEEKRFDNSSNDISMETENDNVIEIHKIDDYARLEELTIPQAVNVVDGCVNPSVETQVPEQLSKVKSDVLYSKLEDRSNKTVVITDKSQSTSEGIQMSEPQTEEKVQTTEESKELASKNFTERSKQTESLVYQMEETSKISEADVTENIANVSKQASQTINVTKAVEKENNSPSSQTSKFADETNILTDSSEKTKQRDKPTQTETSKKTNIEQMKYTEEVCENILETDKPSRRKRGKSISSNKSNTSTKSGKTEKVRTEEKDTPKTPIGRKRGVSFDKTAEEEKTPENKSTESETPKKRGRSPSTEVRKILTRRASKELLENESNISLEDVLTPRRRSLRSAKSFDDNASESSMKSAKSKADDDSKLFQVRRPRKSVVTTKSELSVIPENAPIDVSESQKGVQEYVSLKSTREPKLGLESWLQPSPRPSASNTSNASCISIASTASLDSSFEKDTSPPSPFNVQPIDRISLLNRPNFEGPPDTEELHNSAASPDSLASEVNRTPLRGTRARSEAKTTGRLTKTVSRRMSEDMVYTSKLGSPVLESSPIRARRASFNRACEALHTPKGRRASTDLRRGDSDSAQGSPSEAETTPARRTRKASTQSNTSQGRPEAGKKSKKTSP